VFGDDGEHFFNTGELFRGGTGCTVTLFGVKIFGRQVCWHNDILVTGISLLATYSANVKENRKESQPLHVDMVTAARAYLGRLISKPVSRIYDLVSCTAKMLQKLFGNFTYT
jgi:hypothetical protein